MLETWKVRESESVVSVVRDSRVTVLAWWSAREKIVERRSENHRRRRDARGTHGPRPQRKR